MFSGNFFFGLGIFACILFLASCNQSEDPNNVNNIDVNSSKDLIAIQVTLPDPEGGELFKANCITCHSLRYIQMQPDFPEKTWQKIVDKMLKNFGAPIPDSSVKAIVKYLVTIKGKKD